MIGRHSFWSVLVTTSVLLLSLSAPSPSDSPMPPTEVRGEVLMLTSELLVVALADGRRILFHLEKDANVDSSLKVADRVEVRVTPDHHVISVKKLTGELLQ